MITVCLSGRVSVGIEKILGEIKKDFLFFIDKYLSVC